MKECVGTGVQGCCIASLLPLKRIKVTSVCALVPWLGGGGEGLSSSKYSLLYAFSRSNPHKVLLCGQGMCYYFQFMSGAIEGELE